MRNGQTLARIRSDNRTDTERDDADAIIKFSKRKVHCSLCLCVCVCVRREAGRERELYIAANSFTHMLGHRLYACMIVGVK